MKSTLFKSLTTYMKNSFLIISYTRQTVFCLFLMGFMVGCYMPYGSNIPVYQTQNALIPPSTQPIRADEIIQRVADLGIKNTIRKKSSQPGLPDADATVLKDHVKNGLSCKDVLTHYVFNQANSEGIISTVCYVEGANAGWYLNADVATNPATSENQQANQEDQSNSSQALQRPMPPYIYPAPPTMPWMNTMGFQPQIGYGYRIVPPPIWMAPMWGNRSRFNVGFQFYR